eukprot:91079-Pelagomonas_calceolata.AAC.5
MMPSSSCGTHTYTHTRTLQAPNYSLQQLILNFVARRDKQSGRGVTQQSLQEEAMALNRGPDGAGLQGEGGLGMGSEEGATADLGRNLRRALWLTCECRKGLVGKGSEKGPEYVAGATADFINSCRSLGKTHPTCECSVVKTALSRECRVGKVLYAVQSDMHRAT